MDQTLIRDFNNETYSVEEGAAIVEELNSRTKHDVDGYNSMQEVGSKLQNVVEILPYVEINGKRCSFKKHPENNEVANRTVFEPYDFVIGLFWSNTMLWDFAQWLGGDQEVEDNWEVMRYTRINAIPE